MTRTKMTPEEKKAAREAKKQSNLTIIGRIQYKHMDVVRFGVEDRNGKHPATFRVTIIDGVVRSCEDIETGETCDGRAWSGHCCHETRVMAYEAKRAEQLHEAEVIAPLILGEQFAADLPAHVEDSIRSDEFVDPFAGMSKAERMQAYRDMYPDDFYSAA